MCAKGAGGGDASYLVSCDSHYAGCPVSYRHVLTCISAGHQYLRTM